MNDLIDQLEQLIDSGSERVRAMFAELRTHAKDAERYRALRFVGEEFNRYVVIDVTDARVGTRTYRGNRLDVVADEMIQEQSAMTEAGAAHGT
jgi:IMP dehydrogenase/GMP reductase